MSKRISASNFSPIAIDGPAASGKTTLGRSLSQIFEIPFLDTGLMYRAITLLAIREKIPPTETNACTNLTKTIGIGITNDKWARITISNDDVTKLLHSPEIETLVSQYSSIENVRKYMVDLQRGFADTTPAILAGRDIGTVVLPDAPIKFFLDASEKIRATRRETQNSLNTHASSSKNIQATINERDNVDRSRTISPLRRATDAIILETGINTIEEMVTLATQHIDKHSA